MSSKDTFRSKSKVYNSRYSIGYCTAKELSRYFSNRSQLKTTNVWPMRRVTLHTCMQTDIRKNKK